MTSGFSLEKMMPIETKEVLETRLQEINAAISSVLTSGQSYGRSGHNKSSASLSALQALRDDTIMRLNRLNGDPDGIEAFERGDAHVETDDGFD